MRWSVGRVMVNDSEGVLMAEGLSAAGAYQESRRSCGAERPNRPGHGGSGVRRENGLDVHVGGGKEKSQTLGAKVVSDAVDMKAG